MNCEATKSAATHKKATAVPLLLSFEHKVLDWIKYCVMQKNAVKNAFFSIHSDTISRFSVHCDVREGGSPRNRLHILRERYVNTAERKFLGKLDK